MDFQSLKTCQAENISRSELLQLKLEVAEAWMSWSLAANEKRIQMETWSHSQLTLVIADMCLTMVKRSRSKIVERFCFLSRIEDEKPILALMKVFYAWHIQDSVEMWDLMETDILPLVLYGQRAIDMAINSPDVSSHFLIPCPNLLPVNITCAVLLAAYFIMDYVHSDVNANQMMKNLRLNPRLRLHGLRAYTMTASRDMTSEQVTKAFNAVAVTDLVRDQMRISTTGRVHAKVVRQDGTGHWVGCPLFHPSTSFPGSDWEKLVNLGASPTIFPDTNGDFLDIPNHSLTFGRFRMNPDLQSVNAQYQMAKRDLVIFGIIPDVPEPSLSSLPPGEQHLEYNRRKEEFNRIAALTELPYPKFSELELNGQFSLTEEERQCYLALDKISDRNGHWTFGMLERILSDRRLVSEPFHLMGNIIYFGDGDLSSLTELQLLLEAQNALETTEPTAEDDQNDADDDDDADDDEDDEDEGDEDDEDDDDEDGDASSNFGDEVQSEGGNNTGDPEIPLMGPFGNYVANGPVDAMHYGQESPTAFEEPLETLEWRITWP
uniref:Putative mating type 1-1-2 protein n=1 Tax=Knoxdaviesia proteae TaxID=1215355 RepID=A0A1J0CYG3_9PEZI|nr:putative mating type 1-1-2 protein [Knoxdaviesia proteae]